MFESQGFQFNETSWGTVWQPGSPGALPQNSWWRTEFFDISGWFGVPAYKIRFVLVDELATPGGSGAAGWYIDDIKIGNFPIAGPPYIQAVANPCSPSDTVNFSIGAGAYGYQSSDSLNINFYFGDGTDTAYTMFFSAGGFQSVIQHIYTLPGTFSIQAIFSSSIGINDTITYYNYITLHDTCGNISGQVFIDNNSDCTFNTGDFPLRNKLTVANYNVSSYFYAFSETSGSYTFPLAPQNTYTIYPDSNIFQNLTLACPPSGNYIISSVPSSGNDFGLQCIPGFDLSTNVSVWRIRPNVQTCFPVEFSNPYCQMMSGQGKLILDSSLTFVSATPSPNQIIGDTLIWNVTNINLLNSFYPIICILPAPWLIIGDSVCFTSMIELFAGDSVPANNVSYKCALISNSCDPNDKYVSPQGSILPSDELNFHIDFQNTGNDTAYNIFILDTISANLDFATLRINGSSHDMTIDIVNGNILKFNFYNIMLADSNINEPLSHGFINYSIRPKQDLLNGTVINNQAFIYFDFNPPIATSITDNVIDSALATSVALPQSHSTEILIFPNPSDSEIKIILSKNMLSSGTMKIEVLNLPGEKVLSYAIKNPESTLNIRSLESGIYFLRISSHGEIIKNLKLLKY